MRDNVSNHQPYHCLLSRLFGCRSQKTSSYASLAFVRGIQRGPVISPQKWPVTRKIFPFAAVIMCRFSTGVMFGNNMVQNRYRTIVHQYNQNSGDEYQQQQFTLFCSDNSRFDNSSPQHYSDVTMSSAVCSGGDHSKHQSSASLSFVRGIHRWPVDSTHERPETRKMFPFDDVIMSQLLGLHLILRHYHMSHLNNWFYIFWPYKNLWAVCALVDHSYLEIYRIPYNILHNVSK